MRHPCCSLFVDAVVVVIILEEEPDYICGGKQSQIKRGIFQLSSILLFLRNGKIQFNLQVTLFWLKPFLKLSDVNVMR